MSSKVEIWNLALNLVGGSFVTDPLEKSTQADLCRLHYPFALDFVLESQDWNFAVKRQEVAESSDNEPVFGFNSLFKIPSDALRVIEVWDTSRGSHNTRFTNNPLQWQQEEDYIAADTSDQIWMRYITRIEDTTKFTASFVTALSTYLASRLAIPVAANRTLKTDLLIEYQVSLDEAAANNGMTGRTKVLRSNVLISARFRN